MELKNILFDGRVLAWSKMPCKLKPQPVAKRINVTYNYSVQECDARDDERITAVCKPYLLMYCLNTFLNMFKSILVCAVLVLLAGMAFAQNEEKEANLKAAFIYNFTKYITWNESHVEDSFVIAVVGTSPVTLPLNEIAKTNTVNNKKIIVRNFSKPDDIAYCDILFIPQNLSFSLESILSKVGNGVLTISEEDGFAKQGTALNFVIVNDKLKFEANLRSLTAAGLKAGSQLLKLAVNTYN